MGLEDHQPAHHQQDHAVGHQLQKADPLQEVRAEVVAPHRRRGSLVYSVCFISRNAILSQPLSDSPFQAEVLVVDAGDDIHAHNPGPGKGGLADDVKIGVVARPHVSALGDCQGGGGAVFRRPAVQAGHGEKEEIYEKDIPIYLHTKDEDYIQLVSDNTKLWMVTSKADDMYKEIGIDKKDINVPSGIFEYTCIFSIWRLH